MPGGIPSDFPLYKNDPSSTTRLFRPEEYPGGLTWLVSMEGTYTQTTLQNPNPEKAASTMRQPGMAGDLNVRVKWDYLRLRADLTYADLSYVLINAPSFVPFQALSSKLATITPEYFSAVGADYFIDNLNLTVGVTGGIEWPATFKGHLPDSFANALPQEALPSSAVVVVRSEGVFDILPANYNVVPIYAAKLNAVLQLGGFNVLAEVLLGYDNNVTHLQRINNDPEQVSTRVFTNPWQLGFNVAFQARL